MFTDKILEQILDEGHLSSVPRSATLEYDHNGISLFAQGDFSEYFITSDFNIHVSIKDKEIQLSNNQAIILKQFLEEKAREAVEAESREPQLA